MRHAGTTERHIETMAYKNIILTGFMGTGKTSVGTALAKELGWEFVDTDDSIEELESMTVPEIFAKCGEARFRALEREFCEQLSARKGLVVATGGGMPINPANRKLLNAVGLVINLRCDLDEILKRIGESESRPMLVSDPVQQARDLLRDREPAYASFPFQVNTTGLTISDVVARITGNAQSVAESVRFLAVNVSPTSGYTIALGPGVLDLVGKMASGRGLSSRVAVVTDSTVGPLYVQRVLSALRSEGFRPFSCTVPAGEESKNTRQLEALYGQFLEEGLDRRGAVVALGGGVVGDLAGYAAATYMRGVAFIQCPTSLLAMVDSSVGGKTGVDLPQGKNLAGAFKQPILVAADTGTLASLPESQVRMGMAELIKHAVIDDADLFNILERSQGIPDLTADLVARSVSVKVRVVEADPYESGLREVLNLGHTVGHALEKCSRYALDHGAAVSIGLVAAAMVSARIGMCDSRIASRLEDVLTRSGLPVRHSLDIDELISVMAADKKTVEGRVRFVLIRDIGQVQNGLHVPADILKEALETLKV
jgi:shikimate kinase / 3-dehydroquinate synthase